MTNSEKIRQLLSTMLEELTPDLLHGLKLYFQMNDPLSSLPPLFQPPQPAGEQTDENQRTSVEHDDENRTD